MPTIPRSAQILLGAFCFATAVSDAQGQATKPDLTITLSATKPKHRLNPQGVLEWFKTYEIIVRMENRLVPLFEALNPLDSQPFPFPPPLIAAEPIPSIVPMPYGADASPDVLFTVTPSYGTWGYGKMDNVQSQPSWWPFNCMPQLYQDTSSATPNPLQMIDPTATRCVINGPLEKGGSWTVTMELKWPHHPGTFLDVESITWTATIDDGNRVEERDEGNNSASLTVTP